MNGRLVIRPGRSTRSERTGGGTLALGSGPRLGVAHELGGETAACWHGLSTGAPGVSVRGEPALAATSTGFHAHRARAKHRFGSLEVVCGPVHQLDVRARAGWDRNGFEVRT